MPRFPIARLVAGLSGRISGPKPRINKSTTPMTNQQFTLHIPPNQSRMGEEKRKQKQHTRPRPKQPQNSKPLLPQLPLPPRIDQLPPIPMFSSSLPRPPAKRLPAHQQCAVAPGNPHPRVECETVCEADIYRRGRGRCVCEHVELGEVCFWGVGWDLLVFVVGVAAAGDWRSGVEILSFGVCWCYGGRRAVSWLWCVGGSEESGGGCLRAAGGAEGAGEAEAEGWWVGRHRELLIAPMGCCWFGRMPCTAELFGLGRRLAWAEGLGGVLGTRSSLTAIEI